LIEADFQREYNLNLMEVIDDMSSRRFFNLLYGLSPNSMFWFVQKNKEDKVESPEEAERVLTRLFKAVH